MDTKKKVKMKQEDKKKVKKETIKEVFERTQITNAFELAKQAGVQVASAKTFLKKNNQQLTLTTESRINLKNVNFCPSGNRSSSHWQADITYMHDYKKFKGNSNHIGILTVLNTTTRLAYARAVKSSKGTEISKAMEDIIAEDIGFEKISILLTDGGSEFDNHVFKKAMENIGIVLDMSVAHKSSRLNRTNRFHRTLKGLIRDQFAVNQDKIWVPYLQSIIEEYNNTGTQAFRNIESMKVNRKNGTKKYTPISPQVMANSGKIIEEIHDHERNIAKQSRKIDNSKFEVGDHVHLLKAHTKESIKANGKFLKKSVANSWTTKIYVLEARAGPNSWLIANPGTEIPLWQTYMLKKASKEAYENQDDAVVKEVKQAKAIKVSKAKVEEERNISAKEQKEGLKAPATGRTRRATKIDYAKLATTGKTDAKRPTRAKRVDYAKLNGK